MRISVKNLKTILDASEYNGGAENGKKLMSLYNSLISKNKYVGQVSESDFEFLVKELDVPEIYLQYDSKIHYAGLKYLLKCYRELDACYEKEKQRFSSLYSEAELEKAVRQYYAVRCDPEKAVPKDKEKLALVGYMEDLLNIREQVMSYVGLILVKAIKPYYR